MHRIECFKCKGSGQVGLAINPLIMFLTGGMAYIADTSETCSACNGNGYIEQLNYQKEEEK